MANHLVQEAMERQLILNGKKLWALPLPNKVLHFLWRIATYSLPLRMKLKNRGMEIDSRCPVCLRYDEDGGHCFLKCKMVRRLWSLAQMNNIRDKLMLCNGPLSLFNELFRLTEEESIKVCVMFWLWWHERNKANAGDTMKTPDEILASINYHVNNFRNLKKQRSTQKQTSTAKWSPPANEFLKVNSDGAFKEASKSGGWGFTLRNSNGMLLAAGAGKLEYVSSALHAEALAMVYAINATSSMGANRVIFEMDSTELKQSITSQEYDRSALGSLFQEIKLQLNVAFDDVKLNVCPRACNNAAHTIAAYGHGLGSGVCETWLGHFPVFVLNSVAGNLASLSS
ncbi:hypothetical protein VPH35_111078 [Triticum aestivum]